MARNRKEPSFKAEPPPATAKDSQTYENSLTLVPITNSSDPQDPGSRGQYRIPPKLYKSLSTFLNPNADTRVLESRIADVTRFLDTFVGESKPQVDDEDMEDVKDQIDKTGMPERAVDVTVEIHPRRKHRSSGSISAEEHKSGKDVAAKTQTQCESGKRRKLTAVEHKATKLRDAIQALDDSDDNSSRAKRKVKRQGLYSSDQAQLNVQLGQSDLSDSSGEVEDEFDVHTKMAASRDSSHVNRAIHTTTKLGGDSSTKTQCHRISNYRRRYDTSRYAPNTDFANSLKESGPRGMSSEQAIRQAHERVNAKNGVKIPEPFAMLFARLFSTDTIANLLNACKNYADDAIITLPLVVDEETSKPPRGMLSIKRSTTLEEDIPDVVTDLLDAYSLAETEDTRYGVSVGVAITYYREAIFAQKLKDAYNQIEDQQGEFWNFLQRWTAGPGGHVDRQQATNEFSRFVIERAYGRPKRELNLGEWAARRQHLGRLAETTDRKGLEEFLSEILVILPEYNDCFQELNERLWEPIVRKEKLAPIRMLSIEGIKNDFKDMLETNTVRYWLELDEAAKDNIS
ncbi:MAG: hypothetical protein Q9169_006633 [Polycauliona sp. 2 TL-2023]